MKIYTRKIVVGPEYIDDRDHVNNVSFVQWVQDISKEHWLHEVKEPVLSKFFWVVRTHHIEYKKEVLLGDEITAKTFVANYKGPFSDRVVEFYKGDTLVAAANSTWCLIDIEEKKPIRIPESIKNLFEKE